MSATPRVSGQRAAELYRTLRSWRKVARALAEENGRPIAYQPATPMRAAQAWEREQKG
jgi:hypothetical protein